jgi:hypothetical protein
MAMARGMTMQKKEGAAESPLEKPSRNCKEKENARYEIYPDEFTNSYRRDLRGIILSKLRSGNEFEKARMAIAAVDVETRVRNVREA